MAAVWSLVVDLAHEMRLLATGEATETSFIVLFRSRGARFGAIHAPALFTDCDIGGASLSAYARPAPAPEDALWSSLVTPRPVVVCAWSGTLLLFALWNVPVALVQSLASLDSITKMLQEAHLKGAAGMIHNLSPATRATLEGWMPVLVLTVLQMLTLYSGLLPALSRLQRRESGAAAGTSTLHKMFFFNQVLVLLGSCVVGSLFETAKLILSGGYCTLLALLGRSVPAQATFWVNYLVLELLFYVPALDILQVLPLSVVGAARLCGARGKALSGKALSALQRLYYPSIYARALMVLSAAFLFATIAPLITLVTIAWLYAVSRAWSFNVRRVYLHDLGADFDSGGAYWPVAMRLETFALLTAQLVLVAIHVLNSCWYSGTVLFGLMIATMVRASRLQRHYSPLASELPLERCIKVDASMAGDTSPGAQAYQLDWILAEASRAYRTSFENSSFRSGDLLAGGQ